ncbi:hypothetical protein Nepgr_028652 [Nepenthes gracilis]|uniref:Uncharacterized protein n=1 Tax=Nepenthes gracilis TaxID=150966 RepID=A0AAD3TDA0_NEPGR|nr:hypothetical protein Nepgr_028652 [Nepenthes gracilis]
MICDRILDGRLEMIFVEEPAAREEDPSFAAPHLSNNSFLSSLAIFISFPSSPAVSPSVSCSVIDGFLSYFRVQVVGLNSC